jgi:small subunit ribosomal protein S14
MSKVSQVNRNHKRERMAARDKRKRQTLKDTVMDRTLPVEDRFEASIKLAQLPRNGAKIRVRLRCELTGRARGNYRGKGAEKCRCLIHWVTCSPASATRSMRG